MKEFLENYKKLTQEDIFRIQGEMCKADLKKRKDLKDGYLKWLDSLDKKKRWERVE